MQCHPSFTRSRTATQLEYTVCLMCWGGGGKRGQRNLSIKDTLNRGHLSNEDTVWSANGIELCTKLPLN